MELSASFRVARASPLLTSYSTPIRQQGVTLPTPNFHRRRPLDASFLLDKSWPGTACKTTFKRTIESVPKAKSIRIIAADCPTKDSQDPRSLESLFRDARCTPEDKVRLINEYLCQFIDHHDYQQFCEKVEFMSEYFSIRCRAVVMIKWLLMISRVPQVMKMVCLNKEVQSCLVHLIDEFNLNDAKEIQKIQENKYYDHVKAVEEFLIRICNWDPDLVKLFKFFNLSCKPQDINNLAFAFMMNLAVKKFILAKMDHLINDFSSLAKIFDGIPALNFHQGLKEPTLGNQIATLVQSLGELKDRIKEVCISEKTTLGKKIHCVCLPTSTWIDLEEAAKEYVTSLGISYSPSMANDQVQHHHEYANEFLLFINRFNYVLSSLNIQIKENIYRLEEIEEISADIESSTTTVPCKISPIDFEYSQAHLGMAGCAKLIRTLETENYQEGLSSNSTFLRDMGKFLGHSFLAYKNTLNGTAKLETINEAPFTTAMFSDSVGQIIDGVMQMYEVPADSETQKKLKELRQKRMTMDSIAALIEGLEIPTNMKRSLSDIITPGIFYVGADQDALEKNKGGSGETVSEH